MRDKRIGGEMDVKTMDKIRPCRPCYTEFPNVFVSRVRKSRGKIGRTRKKPNLIVVFRIYRILPIFLRPSIFEPANVVLLTSRRD